MSLDKETVKNIAFLARIKTPEEELEPLAKELSNILGWVEQLSEVDTDGVEPMAGPTGIVLPRRADEVNDGGDPDKVLANAPDREGEFYAVPKVIE